MSRTRPTTAAEARSRHAHPSCRQLPPNPQRQCCETLAAKCTYLQLLMTLMRPCLASPWTDIFSPASKRLETNAVHVGPRFYGRRMLNIPAVPHRQWLRSRRLRDPARRRKRRPFARRERARGYAGAPDRPPPASTDAGAQADLADRSAGIAQAGNEEPGMGNG
jgi:hypothetical protein